MAYRLSVQFLLACAVGVTCQSISARAATITKADNLQPLNDPASWVTNTLPAVNDLALFDNTLAANFTFSLGGNTQWAGIQLTNPLSDITINDVGHTLSLGGTGIDMSAATANLTLNGILDAGGTTSGTLSFNVATRLTINSNIMLTVFNGSSITKNGAGTVVLAGANKLGGAINLNAGMIRLASSNALTLSEIPASSVVTPFAAPAIVFSSGAPSGTLDLASYNAQIASLVGNGIITNSDPQASTLTLLTPATGFTGSSPIFFGSITDGTGGTSLVIHAAGTQIFVSQNTYTGDTVLERGALNLGFNAASAPLSNILSSGSRLVLAGGALTTTPKGNQNTSQSFNGTVINPGASILDDSATATGSNMALILGNITRNAGGTVRFAPQTSGTPGLAGIFSSTPVLSSGILGGWATVGLFDWASKDANGNITALNPSAYTSTAAGASSFAPALNTDMTTNLDLSAAAADLHTASLRFNAAAPTTLTLNGHNVIDSGGILVSSASASYAALIIGAADLTSGNGQDLIVTTSNNAPITIATPIVDNGATSIALTVRTSASLSTKSAYGQITLAAPNTYSGGTFINNGELIVAPGASLGSGAVFIQRASNLGTSNLILGDGLVLPNNITFHDDAATFQFAPSSIDVASGNSATLSGNITAPAEPRNQYRIGTSGGTLVLTGTHTAGATGVPAGIYSTYIWGATNPNPANGPPVGQVIFAGNSSLTSYGTPIGMRAANLLLRDNAAITVISASTGSGFSMGLGYIFSNYPGANILTLQDNASLNLGTLNFDLQNMISGNNTLNLNGGSITLSQFVKSMTLPTTLNFNGTTLRATTDTAAFLPNFIGNTALVQPGGARIHTNGHAITIAQSLTHDSALGTTPDGGLTKLGPGTLTLTSTANTFTGPLSIQQDTLALASPVALKINTLQLAHTNTGTTATYTATLQTNASRLILQSTDPTDKQNKILQLNEALFAGHNGSNNSYVNASGITSAAVAADSKLTLGVFDNAALHKTSWGGGTNNADDNSLSVSPALKGDANLDGVVNFNDMLVVTGNWNLSGLSNGISTIDMAHGDLNGDGIVNFNDMLVVTGNWNNSSSAFNLTTLLSDGLQSSGLEGQSPVSAVPEPAALSLVGLIPFLLQRARRRRRSGPAR